MFCIDRASYLYMLAGGVSPVIVGLALCAVGVALVWRARK